MTTIEKLRQAMAQQKAEQIFASYSRVFGAVALNDT